MAEYQAVFKRYEKKYLISTAQKEALYEKMLSAFVEDHYSHYDIQNLYFDSDTDELIRTSIARPAYKEKLRLRGYQNPVEKNEAFIELKKKYDGVVYKRRIATSLDMANDYLYHQIRPKEGKVDTQILNEIEWVIRRYQLKPAAFISYTRDAYVCKINSNLRVTFDTKIRGRDHHLVLGPDLSGIDLLSSDMVLMEIKTADSLPLWFCRWLSELQIYPTSFSKYGTFYQKCLKDKH